MGDLTESLTPSSATVTASVSSNPRPMPVREDCWSEEATSTLVDAWGRRYVELNRGNLRQKDWQEVAGAVNALHGHTKKTHRTDVQCKNRVDTIKKKYKAEKARVSAGYGVSTWPFYDRLDSLIGSTAAAVKNPSISPPVAVPLPIAYRKPSPSSARPVVTAMPLPQKRMASMAALNERSFRMNYSAIAAAAAAEDDDDDDDDEDADEDEDEDEAEPERDSEDEIGNGGGGIGGEGLKRLAKAIERFGDVYERVENDKIRQMVDLEKQKMQFAMDLEVQRMRMFVDTQVQLERIKRSGSNDIYS